MEIAWYAPIGRRVMSNDPPVADMEPVTPPPSVPDSEDHKRFPLARGLLDYFPDALLAVANCSLVANEQHNPGEPLHWAKEKSADHADALIRHLIHRGKTDDDGIRHATKVAWRALALLQTALEGVAA
jgi:hypothetical protein